MRRGFGPNPASVLGNDSVNGSQSNARAGEVGMSVQPLKRDKEFRRMHHAEPGSVVTDEVGESVVALLGSKLNAGYHLAGEFPSISEQILKGNPHESPVGMDKDFVFDAAFHFSIWLVARKLFKHGPRYSGKIDALLAQLRTTQAGEL